MDNHVTQSCVGHDVEQADPLEAFAKAHSPLAYLLGETRTAATLAAARDMGPRMKD